MSDSTASSTDAPTQDGAFSRFLRATEIDTRLLGMLGALALIWGGFHFYGQFVNGFGAFLTPRNLWNLSVQTSSIGIMAWDGVGHHHPTHRPVCRFCAGLLRHCHGRYPKY